MPATSWRQWLGFAVLAAMLAVGATLVVAVVVMRGCAC